jgi:hypothetical protein
MINWEKIIISAVVSDADLEAGYFIINQGVTRKLILIKISKR